MCMTFKTLWKPTLLSLFVAASLFFISVLLSSKVWSYSAPMVGLPFIFLSYIDRCPQEPCYHFYLGKLVIDLLIWLLISFTTVFGIRFLRNKLLKIN